MVVTIIYKLGSVEIDNSLYKVIEGLVGGTKERVPPHGGES